MTESVTLGLFESIRTHRARRIFAEVQAKSMITFSVGDRVKLVDFVYSGFGSPEVADVLRSEGDFRELRHDNRVGMNVLETNPQMTLLHFLNLEHDGVIVGIDPIPVSWSDYYDCPFFGCRKYIQRFGTLQVDIALADEGDTILSGKEVTVKVSDANLKKVF